jgi:hypothetical protein
VARTQAANDEYDRHKRAAYRDRIDAMGRRLAQEAEADGAVRSLAVPVVLEKIKRDPNSLSG